MKTWPRRSSLPVIIAIAVLILSVSAVSGGSGEKSPAVPRITPLTNTWIAESDSASDYPHSDIGAHLRVRYVNFQNVVGLGTEQDPHRRFFRVRSRAWYERRFSPGLTAYVKINNESRKYLKCESCESEFGEIIFENLFFEYVLQSRYPLGIRVGRQDLFYGNGFVICDGTPIDESRTTYVNGILITSGIPDWSFDIFAVWNRQKDEYLPRINNEYRELLEYDEFVAGLMLRKLKAPSFEASRTLEYYYLYKQEKRSDRTGAIHTFGSRLTLPFGHGILSAEFAYQGGKGPESVLVDSIPDLAGGRRISAYGGQADLVVHVSRDTPVDVAAGYVHLSGDDAITRNKDEGWNPVLARWPKWSDLYIYTLSLEAPIQPMQQSIAYWQNLRFPYIGIMVSPHRAVRIEARHLWLSAVKGLQENPFERRPTVFLPKDRGNLLIVNISWNTPFGATGHLLLEHLYPGGFYPSDAEDATFMRFEVSMPF